MVKLKIEVRAELENVTDLEPQEESNVFAPVLKVQCSSCREIHQNWVTVDPSESRPMSGSRGTANFVWKCPQCKRESSANFDTAFKRSPLTAEQADSHQWSTLAVVECRGCELVEIDPFQSQWKCQGRETGTKFADIDLTEWTDYDEKAGEPVGITEVQTRISRF